MQRSILHSLHTTERDTLGLDASAPPSLHADVLDASERALASALLLGGALAEAPKAPTAGARAAARFRGLPLTPAIVEAARQHVEALAKQDDGAERRRLGRACGPACACAACAVERDLLGRLLGAAASAHVAARRGNT